MLLNLKIVGYVILLRNIAKYQPEVIKTDDENEQAIALAEEIAHRPNKTAEESALFELLIALIEKYEDEKYLMVESSPCKFTEKSAFNE